MSKKQQYQTKKGAASIYVTIFVALILSVVTLSFARLAISELSKTGDDDLYASAYDSALAGIEDAKIAIDNCLKNTDDINECNVLLGAECNSFIDSGYITRTVTPSSKEVFIQEKNTNSDETITQAYTCVIMKNDLTDFRDTITKDSPVRVVPIPGDTTNITIAWDDKNSSANSNCNSSNCYFNKADNKPTPEVISATLVDNNNSQKTAILYPKSTDATNTQSIAYTKFDSKKASDSDKNQPIQIDCAKYDEFYCSIKITGVSNIKYLVLSAPYDENIKFMVEATNSSNDKQKFNTQVSVDSTGRANDIFRRVETRVNIGGEYPYTPYGLDLDSGNGGDDGIKKNFYITKNCQTVDNGRVGTCPNYKDL